MSHPKRATLPRLISLAALFLCAKWVLLALLALDRSAGGLWTPVVLPAIYREDGLFLVVFAGLDWVLGRIPRMDKPLWLIYLGVVVYTAVNVPIARVLSTPLTYPILRAAGGALQDSIFVYVTWTNLLAVSGLVLFSGMVALWALFVWRRGNKRLVAGVFAVLALPFVVSLLFGRAAQALVPTRGLHRNPLVALVATTLFHLHKDRPSAVPVPPLPEQAKDPGIPLLKGAFQGRDVLWIILESTAANYLAPYGAKDDPMPTLSQLANKGMVFENIYAAYPESIKGLFSELCATTPAAHTNAESYAGNVFRCDSIAERFSQASYNTAIFHSGWFAYLGMHGVVLDRGFATRVDAGDIGGPYATSFGVAESAAVERVLLYYDALPKGQRSFVMYLPISGHHPYMSPGPGDRPRPFAPSPLEPEDLTRYKNDLFSGDQALAVLFRGLAASGRLSKMLVVISGDHGEAFFQHEGNVGHTLSLYEENLHVPLVFSGEGLPSGARMATVGSVIDIAPTILWLVGLSLPGIYQGRPLLEERRGVARFFTDHAVFQLGLRESRWKFIDEPETGRGQLYDLQVDPLERHNLAGGHPERVQSYRAHLRGYFQQQRVHILHPPR